MDDKNKKIVIGIIAGIAGVLVVIGLIATIFFLSKSINIKIDKNISSEVTSISEVQTKAPTQMPTASLPEETTVPTKSTSTQKPVVSSTSTPTSLSTIVPTKKPATKQPTVESTVKPTAKPTQKPTAKPTTKPTKKPTVSSMEKVEKNISKYVESVEWLMFEARGSEVFSKEMSSYEKYISKSLLQAELADRKAKGLKDIYKQKAFPIFTLATNTNDYEQDVYIAKGKSNEEKILGTYEEMVNSMKSKNGRYTSSYAGICRLEKYWLIDYTNTKEEQILYEKEMVGYSKFTYVSMDKKNKTIRLRNNKNGFAYTCSIDDYGKISDIYIAKTDIVRYEAYYKLMEKEGSMYVRDFNGDGIEELFNYVDTSTGRYDISSELRGYTYQNGKVKLSITEHFDGYFGVTFIGKNGYWSSTGTIIVEHEDLYNKYINGKFKYVDSVSAVGHNMDELQFFVGDKEVKFSKYCEHKKKLIDASKPVGTQTEVEVKPEDMKTFIKEYKRK